MAFDPLRRTWLASNKGRRERSCHLLATQTGQRFLLRWDTSLDATVGQMLNVTSDYAQVRCAPSATRMQLIH